MEARTILSSISIVLSYYLTIALKSLKRTPYQQPNRKVLAHNPRISRTVTPPNQKEWTYNRVFTNIHNQILASPQH